LRALLLLCALLGCGCERKSEGGLVKHAEFGVFFGGQVQELKEIPKQLDAARQRHGFRLSFAAPLRSDVKVGWEISLPVPERGGPRPALVGEATAKSGQSVLDVPLAFRPSDPLGVWHAKVTADGVTVIDRDFTVTAPPR
jgi:hypothetical protein